METLYFAVIVITTLQFTTGENEYCYVNDEHPYLYFGSKTSYDTVRGQEMPTLPDCTPTYIWALIRHGNRFRTTMYSTVEDMKELRDKIIENHEKYKRGELCQEDLELLKKWTFKWNEKVHGELTEQGKADMSSLAKRLKNTFKNLMENPIRKFNFATSSKSRARDSSLAFTNELFGTAYTKVEDHEIKINDALLRILEHFPISTHEEVKRFEQSKYVTQLAESISKRLGFESVLNSNTLSEIESYCAFETSWDHKAKAAWCSALTPEHIKVFEFLEDIKTYYKEGYGRPEALRASCILVKDMTNKLIDAVSSGNAKVGDFYFTHSETMVPFLAKLGLYSQDKPLNVDNYEKQLHNRVWRKSLFDPFASNFIAVTYKCPKENKLIFYQNEKKVNYPNCENGVCSLEVVENLIGELTPEKCDTSPYVISNDDDDFDFDFEDDVETIGNQQIDKADHNTNSNRKESKKSDEKETNNANDDKILNKKDTSSGSDGILCSRIYLLMGSLISMLVVSFLYTR